jgi:hypothetical protein
MIHFSYELRHCCKRGRTYVRYKYRNQNTAMAEYFCDILVEMHMLGVICIPISTATTLTLIDKALKHQ